MMCDTCVCAYLNFIHSLYNNCLGPEGAAAIAPAMKKITKLQTLV